MKEFFFLSCADNDVSLILRNNSNNPVRFYQTDNSRGYQNYSFIIKTKDTTCLVTKAVSMFWKNVLFYHTILPHESLVLNFNIKDTRCDFEFTSNGRLKRNIIRVTNGWQGLPDKPIEQATVQALYKLPAEHTGFKPFGATIYSDSLLSNTLNISIQE